jgi:hypothetical protein
MLGGKQQHVDASGRRRTGTQRFTDADAQAGRFGNAEARHIADRRSERKAVGNADACLDDDAHGGTDHDRFQ